MDLDAPQPRRTTVQAVAALEQATQEAAEWVVLRYGMLYGPDTWYEPQGSKAAAGRQWVPAFCQAVGAPVPAVNSSKARAPWARGADNRHARTQLGWSPRYPSWRQGFHAMPSSHAVADVIQ